MLLNFQIKKKIFLLHQFSSVAESGLTLCDPMDCCMPGFPCLSPTPELAQTHVHQVRDAIQISHTLLSPSPHVFSLSQHRGLFQQVCFSHQVAKVLELQLQHQSFQWIFSTDFLLKSVWFDLLVVQGTLKNLLQHDSSKASIVRHSAFFMAQLSYPYITTGKTIALILWAK